MAWIGIVLMVAGVIIIFTPMASAIAELTREHPKGLAITLLSYFIVSLFLQAFFGWQSFVSEQATHGQSPQVFGPDGYMWAFGDRVFENWQSEFLQLAIMVIVGSSLRFPGSSESKDSSEQSDRTEYKLDEVLRIQKEQAVTIMRIDSRVERMEAD